MKKLRKRAAILSIIDRLSLNVETSESIVEAIQEFQKDVNADFWEMPIRGNVRKYINHVVVTYESIRFDFQTSIDIKKEDFDRLFPKIEYNFSTFSSINSNLICLNSQMLDMMAYCRRLV